MCITLRSVQLRILAGVTSGTGIDQCHRYMLVLDRQVNGVAAAIGDILSAGTIYAMRNLANRKRFKILWDKCYNLNSAGESGSQRMIKPYFKFKKPLKVDYNTGNVGDITDVASNAVYFIALSQVGAGTTAGFCTGFVRIRFTDV